MGLPDAKQQDLHNNHWRRIEQTLGAEHTTEPTDTFLRDVLRWRAGRSRASIQSTKDCDVGQCESDRPEIGRLCVAISRASPAFTCSSVWWS